MALKETFVTDPIPDPLPAPEPIEATVDPIAVVIEDPVVPESSAETTYIEYGIRLPNGQVHWGSYSGRPIDTPETRRIFVDVLRKTADDLGFSQDEFLGRYAWQGRHVRLLDLGEVPITSEAAAPPLPEPTDA